MFFPFRSTIYTEHNMRKNFTNNLSVEAEDKLNEFNVALIAVSQESIAQSKYRDG